MEIRNGDVALHVSDDGDRDAPPVLVLHGITSSTATWDWLVPHLAADHRVLRLDFRGHGRSGRAPGTYHFPSYVADAIAVCEQVAQTPCRIIGHSLGGGTAAALAQQRPDLVVGAVLEDPALAGADDAPREGALSSAFGLMRESVPRLQESGIPHDALVGALAKAPAATGAPFGELLHDDAIVAMATSLLQLDATVLDPVLDGSMVTAYDAGAPIPVPTLVLAADPSSPDAVVRPATVERLASVSPTTKVTVIDGAGHLIHDERAHRERFLAETLTFLRSLG